MSLSFGSSSLTTRVPMAISRHRCGGAVRMPDHEHHPSLARDEIAAFLAALGNYSGRKETAAAIKLLLLLFPRPGELLGASWAEFDLDAALWRIPAERMKMGEEHLIPLPSQAVELLRGLKFLTGKYPHLFPHRDQRHKPTRRRRKEGKA